VVFQVDLYDGNTFWYILVLRRLFATDESNLIFLECGNALEYSTAESGPLLRSTRKLCELVSAGAGSILTPYQTIFLMIDSDAIVKY
jgi:hypothetical protein